AKRESGTGHVVVNAIDINDLSPLSGVEVKQIVKSGRVVSRCSTDRRGSCSLDEPGAGPDKSEPFALIATRSDDVTYLRYSDLKTEISESEVQGEPYKDPREYHAALYSDRGVYRPGETAHLAAIVRGKDNLAPKSGMPLDAQLIDPRGKTTRRLAVK